MADEVDTNTQTPQTEARQEPIPAPELTPEPQTAQFPPNEPLPPTPVEEVKTEPEPIEPEIPEAAIPEPKSETQTSSQPESKPQPASQPQEQSAPVVVPPIVNKNPIREFLTKARNAIQIRKRKKLEKIMSLFAKRTNITNDEVEKLLHVSDATATRYLSTLEKEGKIKMNGKTGKAVS